MVKKDTNFDDKLGAEPAAVKKKNRVLNRVGNSVKKKKYRTGFSVKTDKAVNDRRKGGNANRRKKGRKPLIATERSLLMGVKSQFCTKKQNPNYIFRDEKSITYRS